MTSPSPHFIRKTTSLRENLLPTHRKNEKLEQIKNYCHEAV